MEAKNGSVVQFKDGDKFAAAQNYSDLQKQVSGTRKSEESDGGGQRPITIQQSVEISPDTDQTVKAQVREVLPEMKEEVKNAVYDGMGRGGGPSDSVRRAG
jgi:hypothetical protein